MKSVGEVQGAQKMTYIHTRIHTYIHAISVMLLQEKGANEVRRRGARRTEDAVRAPAGAEAVDFGQDHFCSEEV